MSMSKILTCKEDPTHIWQYLGLVAARSLSLSSKLGASPLKAATTCQVLHVSTGAHATVCACSEFHAEGTMLPLNFARSYPMRPKLQLVHW